MLPYSYQSVKASKNIVRSNNIKFTDQNVLKEIYLFFVDQVKKNINLGLDISWDLALKEMDKFANIVLDDLFNDGILIISDNIRKEDAFNQIISKIERNLELMMKQNIEQNNIKRLITFKRVFLNKDYQDFDNDTLTFKRIQKLRLKCEDEIDSLRNKIAII